jgi:hypothetical protein
MIRISQDDPNPDPAVKTDARLRAQGSHAHQTQMSTQMSAPPVGSMDRRVYIEGRNDLNG